ncbi:MAG: hypothetical protein ACM3WS_03620 [Bacillota bacterium]
MQVVSIEDIRRKAYAAVDEGRPMDSCPYPAGSEAQTWWKTFYWQRELQLAEKAEA